ncbi:ferredoxin-type protein NapF [Vibrio sp. SM6]|uniref:Ferredoxin-type protein NapF n=1 Tax=Vibrio agarilyticus TaxID=2726741 RepID=A0A7X8YFG0_9VIBR|nr:ferredoxin-type protein NapF [Vibrio agarilyticus]NLS11336.1 ferredoxin-type protein NapF [Vibrio agarilyticus]
MVDLTKRRWFRPSKQPLMNPTLPWLRDPAQFLDECDRCGACVKVCENHIITLGSGGFPTVDFTQGECSFCYQCVKACPKPLFYSQQHTPWQAEITLTSNCLALRNVECRGCSDNCEYQAITFQLGIGRVAQPQVHNERCVGCGACIAPCPTQALSLELQAGITKPSDPHTHTITITECQ